MELRDLSDHVEYRAGRGIEEVARELGRDPGEFVKLSSNENPHGPSPAAEAAVRDAASEVHRYPKAVHADLTAAVADRWGVADEQVWLANGGDGALDYLARATLDPGDRVLVPTPGFTYYGMSARFHHGRVAEYDVRASEHGGEPGETATAGGAATAATEANRGGSATSDGSTDATSDGSTDATSDGSTDATSDGSAGTMSDGRASEAFALTADTVLEAYDGERVVYLTSPHNPTGHRFTLDAVETIADETGEDTLVVVDEAYGEFTDAPSAVGLVGDRDDVAVLRTFSKAYGLAGLRLGYAVTPTEWADAYARVQTPFAASAIACRAGLAALEDDDHVERTLDSVRWSREHMHEELDAHTYESHANFVLADVGDATAVADAAKREGVLVRDCSSFGLPAHVRVTCGTRAETERAVAVLNEVLAE